MPTPVISTRRSPARLAPLAVAFTCALALFAASPAGAAEAPVGLGAATSFAILAGAGVTNTGATTITGDIGTFPTTSETGFSTIVQTGVNHAGDAVAQQAKLDLVDAFNDAAGRGPATAAVPVDLAGEVLTPGVYSNGTIELSGALTLDAQGDPDAVFVFQAASTLITGSASTVNVINGGPGTACNIYWKVGSSATLGSGSSFVGTVLAQESISLDPTAVVEGRLLARTGAVTLINNTITNVGCPTVPVTPGVLTPAITPPDAGAGTPAGGTPTGQASPPTTSITTSLAFTGNTDPRFAPIGLLAVAAGAGFIALAATHRRRLPD